MSYTHGHPQGPSGWADPNNLSHPNNQGGGGGGPAPGCGPAAVIATAPIWIFGLGIPVVLGLGMLVGVFAGGAGWVVALAVGVADRIGTWPWIILVLLVVTASAAVPIAAELRRRSMEGPPGVAPGGASGYRPLGPGFASSPSGAVGPILGRRLAALGLDLTIVAGAAMVILVPLFVSMAVTDETGRVDCQAEVILDPQGRQINDVLCYESDGAARYIDAESSGLFGFFGAVLVAYLLVLHMVVLEGMTGATLGKRAAGLQVMRESTGAPPGVGRSAVRLGALATIDSQCGVLGLIVAAATPKRQRVGDLLARTVVRRR